MKNKNNRLTFYVFFVQLLITNNSFAQIIVDICRADVVNYSVESYHAHRQNWSITQSSKNNLVYVANSKGLLEFDGAFWKLHPFHQTLRSVMVDKVGRIYTGALGEFGYWENNEKGVLTYHSLKSLIKDTFFAQEAIWNIIETPYGILFQSFAYVYLLKGDKIQKITPPSTILFVQNVNGRFLVGGINKGLYVFDGKQFNLLKGSEFLGKESITAILPTANIHEMLICTDKKVFLFDGVSFRPFNPNLDAFLAKNKLNKALRLKNGNFVFATILSGFVVCDKSGAIQNVYDKKSGLQDNTILAAFTDKEGNIWLGLDNGISMINENSSLKYFQDYDGKLGVIYDAAIFKNNLYLGTNHGLFVTPLLASNASFSLVPQTQGQVLSLDVIDNQLVCGHNEGTFLIENQKAIKISDITGGAVIKKVTSKDLLIQGTYTNLCIYKKNELGKWMFSHKVEKFLEPTRQLEIDKEGNIWVSKGFGGVSRLKLDNNFVGLVEETKFSSGEVGSQANTIFKNGESIYFNDEYGTKKFNYQSKRLLEAKEFANQKDLLKSFPLGAFSLNLYKNSTLGFQSQGSDAVNILPIRQQKWVDTYENIRLIDTENLLFCLENGFAILPTKAIKGLLQENTSIPFVREISLIDNPENKWNFDAQSNLEPEFSYKENNLVIKFADASFSKHGNYSYFLDGYSNAWVAFDIYKEVVFGNLPSGEYKLRVKSNITDKENVFVFRVLAPWYWNFWSKMLYLGLLAAIGYVLYRVHLLNLKRHQVRLKQIHRRRQQIQQQEITKLRNQQLEETLIRKSEELANSTMALIKKNELLVKIKKEVVTHTDTAKNAGSNQITELIDKSISTQHDWKVFETNFNQVHETFLKKLLQSHPDLSNGDLKLAAYLRMNLSSKEIAHLLNITPRSVELKRYRLRKKLGIANEDNLNDFMMKFS